MEGPHTRGAWMSILESLEADHVVQMFLEFLLDVQKDRHVGGRPNCTCWILQRVEWRG